ncbi:hypothetical protein [Roseovarius sp.]|uniref:hypothetical protein n=1 Tax=Roseovarius sp. TaxID=1486281 RepID=UPI0035641B13
MRHLILALAASAAPFAAQAETLTLQVTGEALATDGFTAPELTRDGWRISFDRVQASFADVTAWRTDPPFAADSPDIDGAALALDGAFTVNLADAKDDGRIALATRPAEAGHYNALSWQLAPAPDGAHAGYSLVLQGRATKDGQEVAFTLRSADRVAYACGEYVGDTRKGFVTEAAPGQVEITLHLDHIFGRADLPADDAMNQSALGFDQFADGSTYDISLQGIHLGHVGEGHCHDTTL